MDDTNGKKKVLILSIGGTILSEYDWSKKEVVPARRVGDLLGMIPDMDRWVEFEVVEPFQLPGPHLTVEHGLQLSEEIDRRLLRDDLDGVVVLQGTDTMEEMAYLVHLTIQTDKPVVFTGAMKSNGELFSDALGNIASAIRVATLPESARYGALVVMNQQIHSAVYVTKMHSENMDSFQSPQFGPVGKISMDDVIYYAVLQGLAMTDKGRFRREIEPNVFLFQSYLGMTPQIIACARAAGMKGLVLEGFGAGNLSPKVAEEAAILVRDGIPVIVSTRCFAGRAIPLYAYDGGGKQLLQLGLLFGGDLSGLKCRLKLMLAMGNKREPKEVF